MGCVVVGWLCCFPASGQIEKGGRIREAGMQGWWDSVQWLMEEANLWIGIGSLVWIVCVCVLGRGKDEV